MGTNKGKHKAWCLAHREQIKETTKRWYLAHKEQVKERNKKYYLAHLKQEKERCKKYYLTNSKQMKKYSEEYRLLYPEKAKTSHRNYMQSAKGKKAIKKRAAKRKGFSFIPLNDCFDGSAGHHINTEMVIHIPSEMHTYNRHSVLRDEGMDKINTLAFNWLEAEEMYSQ